MKPANVSRGAHVEEERITIPAAEKTDDGIFQPSLCRGCCSSNAEAVVRVSRGSNTHCGQSGSYMVDKSSLCQRRAVSEMKGPGRASK